MRKGKRGRSSSRKKAETTTFEKHEDFLENIKESVKAKAKKKYPQGTGLFDAYMDVVVKMVSQGLHLKENLDSIKKTEAVMMGYVLKDFRNFETISFFSEEIDHAAIANKKEYIDIPDRRKQILAQSKLSFSKKDNFRIFKQMELHIKQSEVIQIIEIVGIMMREDSWIAISDGCKSSKSLKRLIINNCNLHEDKNLNHLTKGLALSTTIEFIDFQLCNLHDSHRFTLIKLVKEQFELKENLNWKLGLRASKKIKCD